MISVIWYDQNSLFESTDDRIFRRINRFWPYQDTRWIWIIHAYDSQMINLHNEVQFYLRVLFATKISARKNDKCLFGGS
jgi:hypothetical protein